MNRETFRVIDESGDKNPEVESRSESDSQTSDNLYRNERIFLSDEEKKMTNSELMEKLNLPKSTAWKALKRGIIKNPIHLKQRI